MCPNGESDVTRSPIGIKVIFFYFVFSYKKILRINILSIILFSKDKWKFIFIL